MAVPLALERNIAETLVRRGGEAAMRFYGRAVSEAKADASPITQADRASNEVLLEGLAHAFPEDAVLSEESQDDRSRLSRHRVWIVDPLDGTKEFLATNGEFSVMIGLAVNGQPRVGAVYLPAIDVLYSAASGQGAWRHAGGRISRLEPPPAADRLRLIGSRSHPDALLRLMQEALGVDEAQPCGSVGVKCARIAEGEQDVYIHPVPYLKEWDTCGPEVILREAGGTITDCLGKPLFYNKADPVQLDGIVACAPGASRRVLARIRPIYESATGDEAA